MRQEVVKVDKSTWFREQGATAVLMLPTTRGSELAKRVRRMLESTTGPRGTSIKVVEKPGTAIMQGISPNNPFQIQSCGRDLCPFFQTGKTCNGKCYTEGVVYTAQCTVCPGEVKHTYIGETSRTL